MNNFTISIEFKSDWHIGTGSGRVADVNAAIIRDSDDLPYVPAKSAVGVLRHSAELVAHALDEGSDGVWARWVEAVFGSQPSVVKNDQKLRPAALLAAPLYLEDKIRKYVQSLPVSGGENQLTRSMVLDAMTITRAGIAINKQSGTAEENFLRFEERARAGLKVSSEWSLCTKSLGEQVWPAEFLLLASAKLTTAIGGNRRRGAGKAEFTLERLAEFSELKRKIEATKIEDIPEPHEHEYNSTTSEKSGEENSQKLGNMSEKPAHIYDLDITVKTPVIVDAGVWGNVQKTETRIFGTQLLPIISRSLGWEKAQKLIKENKIVVTDAVVTDHAGQQCIPWPRSLVVSKDDTEGIRVDLCKPVEHCKPDEVNPRLKHREGKYLSSGNREVSVPLHQQLHAVIDDQTQRPTSESGGLFEYQAIGVGTRLRAQVFFPEGEKLDVGRTARIGRSSKDDYGLVDIQCVPVLAEKPIDKAHEGIKAGKELTVILTSELLLRSSSGSPDVRPKAVAEALSSALEPTLVLAEPFFDGVNGRFAVCSAVKRRSSWQRSWGLPRPTLTGFAAGSVFVLRAEKDISAEALEQVLKAGIGERRAEGFGRVIINYDLLAAALSAEVPKENLDLLPVPGNIQNIVDAAEKILVGNRARELAHAYGKKWFDPKTTRSQLGNLRAKLTALGDEKSTGDPKEKRVSEKWVLEEWVKEQPEILSDSAGIEKIFSVSQKDNLVVYALKVALLEAIRLREAK